MKLERKATWVENLSIYLANVADQRFEWGKSDCALFAAGAVEAVTGTDLAANFRGQYSSWREAARWLRANDFRSFEEAVSSKLGDPVHPAQAGRGDIVMRRSGNGNILGVCVGKHCWFLGDETIGYDAEYQPITQPTLISYPTLQCDFAWTIGSLYAAS
ncbi:hypothetical protein M2341_000991 [Sphingobium sp. B7D2B]|uniref:DUF6950 family protein n=1 Tax=Sphingobium sp. B7D2B TaxID=2940583 RepID=UPI002224ACD8|nr:hypothetical protein [Sphingobium sp. B7D2B]MCW2365544.1 hypothetical protein [Sphingobium sp. B7D2B]